jgi:hypothetical protein
VMTKVCTHGRKADVAMRMLEQSLRGSKQTISICGRCTRSVYDNDPELAYVRAGC